MNSDAVVFALANPEVVFGAPGHRVQGVHQRGALALAFRVAELPGILHDRLGDPVAPSGGQEVDPSGLQASLLDGLEKHAVASRSRASIRRSIASMIGSARAQTRPTLATGVGPPLAPGEPQAS